jgi:hypothetical protein
MRLLPEVLTGAYPLTVTTDRRLAQVEFRVPNTYAHVMGDCSQMAHHSCLGNPVHGRRKRSNTYYSRSDSTIKLYVF